MKKFLAIALAIVMMAALAVPAFAAYEMTDEADNTVVGDDVHYGEDNDDPNADNYLTDAADSQNTDTTLIKYGVAQAYIVTIPAEINLHENKDEANTKKTVGYVYGIEAIGVYDVVIAGDEELNIYVSSTQYAAGKWTLKDTEGSKRSADVNYKIVVASTDEDYTVVEDNYITDYDNATETLVESGTGEGADAAAALVGHVLNCEVAEGNVGTTGSEAYANLYFSSKGTAQEGTYTDTLTFTVRIEAATKYNPAP